MATPQRAWRAACPNCGAPVDFASAASASAVCGFCRSTLVRDGEALRRIGLSAELFDDHTPLQLGASGRHQGVAFTLVGRLQYGSEGGTWNEWHALFDNQRSGWLSEDNGAYVFAFDAPLPADAPLLAGLKAGVSGTVGGQPWTVASVVRAHLVAAEGELPTAPRLQGEFTVADLRNAQDEVATLDDADAPRVHWSVGRSIALSALSMSGLRESQDKTLTGRSLECPSCGAALTVTLASTQALSCHQCNAVIDVSQGLGADLHHYTQANSGTQGLAPQIPLGSTGRLSLGVEPMAWQVVGYQERCDLPNEGDDDEQTFWREYLLYNRQAGFAFLVDADDGWSWVKPLTGVPELRGDSARWAGASYRKRYGYRAKVTWVQGEFYWRVQRGEVAQVTDYDGTGAAARKRLSCEQTDSEVTWSAGETLDAATVADAFGIAPSARAALQRDVAPFSASGAAARSRLGIVFFVVAVLVMMMLSQCDGDDCDEVRNTFGEASAEFRQCERNRANGGLRPGGGSFGGYSSGGGHK